MMNKRRQQNKLSSPAGFLINALQEDWTDKAISFNLKKRADLKKEQEQDKRNLETAAIRKEICQGIVQEQPEILPEILEVALRQMGVFGAAFAKDKSAEELFQEGGFVTTFMEGAIEAHFPDRFHKVSKSSSKGDS